MMLNDLFGPINDLLATPLLCSLLKISTMKAATAGINKNMEIMALLPLNGLALNSSIKKTGKVGNLLPATSVGRP